MNNVVNLFPNKESIVEPDYLSEMYHDILLNLFTNESKDGKKFERHLLAYVKALSDMHSIAISHACNIGLINRDDIIGHFIEVERKTLRELADDN